VGFEIHTLITEGHISPPQRETIKPEDAIRLRILGTRVNAADITATGSLAGDYLGVLEDKGAGKGF